MINFVLGFVCGVCTLVAIAGCMAAGNADNSIAGFPTKEYIDKAQDDSGDRLKDSDK